LIRSASHPGIPAAAVPSQHLCPIFQPCQTYQAARRCGLCRSRHRGRGHLPPASRCPGQQHRPAFAGNRRPRAV